MGTCKHNWHLIEHLTRFTLIKINFWFVCDKCGKTKELIKDKLKEAKE